MRLTYAVRLNILKYKLLTYFCIALLHIRVVRGHACTQVLATDTEAEAVRLKEAVLSPQMVHPMCVQTFQTCTCLVTNEFFQQVMAKAKAKPEAGAEAGDPLTTAVQDQQHTAAESTSEVLLPDFDSGHGFGGNASSALVKSTKDVFNFCAIRGGMYVTLVVRTSGAGPGMASRTANTAC